MDDAAISFAYAKNLATGHGLVAQLGDAPVEGYSNPLWTLLMSLTFFAGVFDPVWVPKLFGILFAAAGLVVLQRAILRFTPFSLVVGTAAASLVAAQAAIVAWVVSGLENGLYLFLVALLIAVCLSVVSRPARAGAAVLAGLAAAMAALTRPEGILFAPAFPLVLACADAAPRRRLAGIYACAFGIPVAAHLTFRLLYFSQWVPNAYIAKGGPSVGWLLDLLLLQPWMLERLSDVTGSFTGRALALWAPILLVAAVFTEPDRPARRSMGVVFLFLLLGATACLLLPPDWMPEFRFGTPYLLALCVALPMAMARAVERFAPHRSNLVVPIVLSLYVIFAILRGHDRTEQFMDHPPIPLSETVVTAERFARAARQLSIDDPSLLIADVGGPLLSSSIRVVDLGMLTNRRVAEALGEGSSAPDVADFHSYIFETAKPTFIATRAYHSWIAELDSDTRFREAYVPIVEYEDQWIDDRYGERRFSGDYVRREALAEHSLMKLRGLFADAHYVGCGDCSR